jgi:hypothetical protein
MLPPYSGRSEEGLELDGLYRFWFRIRPEQVMERTEDGSL